MPYKDRETHLKDAVKGENNLDALPFVLSYVPYRDQYFIRQRVTIPQLKWLTGDVLLAYTLNKTLQQSFGSTSLSGTEDLPDKVEDTPVRFPILKPWC